MKFFKPAEFDSPDKPGSGALMDPQLISMLETARAQCDFPWNVTSGYRTASHNKEIRGAANSWHLKGKAADIKCTNSAKRRAMVAAAIDAGIPGIEICTRHVHFDMGAPRLWIDVSK